MSTVGLTKAMLEALEHRRKGSWYAVSKATQRRAEQSGFIEARMLGNEGLSPRGHAALAAPRITQAELALLELMERPSHEPPGHALGWIKIGSTQRRTAQRLRRLGLATFDCGDCCWYGRINTTGRTALNNVRAAMGSPDWKDYNAMDYASSYSESAP